MKMMMMMMMMMMMTMTTMTTLLWRVWFCCRYHHNRMFGTDRECAPSHYTSPCTHARYVCTRAQ